MQLARAKLEAAVISDAIHSYHLEYNCYPVSDTVRQYALASGTNGSAGNVTYGGTFRGQNSSTYTASPPALANNSEVMAILLDCTTYPGSGLPTANAGHLKNTNKIQFLSAELPRAAGRTGIGPDLVYRDPWGRPFVITMDLWNAMGRATVLSVGPDGKFDLNQPSTVGSQQRQRAESVVNSVEH
jgi:hypothetical protein